MKIIYMGSPDFAIPALKKIHHSNHQLLACYCQPARAKNRGMKLIHTPVGEYCINHKINYYSPVNFKDQQDIEFLKKLAPDLIVVCAYGLILPQSLLDIPKYGAINIHPSKLPRWRGAAPIQRAIIAGDSETAICIIKMTKALDAGDIILQEDYIISPNITATALHDITAKKGADLLINAIDLIASNQAQYQPQSTIQVSYANKILKSETKIDFNLKGEQIINLIRGLADYPAAYFELSAKRVKIFKAEFNKINNNQAIGAVNLSKSNFSIKCFDGEIKPLILQMEGKRKVTINEFLKGIN